MAKTEDRVFVSSPSKEGEENNTPNEEEPIMQPDDEVPQEDSIAAPPPPQGKKCGLTASKTTKVLGSLIAIAVIVVIALSVALTSPATGGRRWQNGNQAVGNEVDETTFPPSFTPTVRPTSVIPNWRIVYLGMESKLNPSDGSNVITIKYDIGAKRSHQYQLFKMGCSEEITGIDLTETTEVSPKDYDSDSLDVILEIGDIAALPNSNIWDSATSTVEMCIILQLINDKTGDVIKEDARNLRIMIEMAAEFGSSFQTTVNLAQLNQTSEQP